MKKRAHELLLRCPKCDIALLVGAPFSDWLEKAKARGLKNIATNPAQDLSQSDAVWLGDLIDPATQKCPRCNALVSKETEQEWPETCGLCKNPASVFWPVAESVYIGLCYSHQRTKEGSAWVDEQRSKAPRDELDI